MLRNHMLCFGSEDWHRFFDESHSLFHQKKCWGLHFYTDTCSKILGKNHSYGCHGSLHHPGSGIGVYPLVGLPWAGSADRSGCCKNSESKIHKSWILWKKIWENEWFGECLLVCPCLYLRWTTKDPTGISMIFYGHPIDMSITQLPVGNNLQWKPATNIKRHGWEFHGKNHPKPIFGMSSMGTSSEQKEHTSETRKKNSGSLCLKSLDLQNPFRPVEFSAHQPRRMDLPAKKLWRSCFL